MAGKCKYCGFVGTQDEIVDHAGECPVMLEDCQPDTVEETRHIHQQRKRKICPDCGEVIISMGNNNFLCGCGPEW